MARAAVLLDGVKHMVMTTGTPNNTDRGAAVLCDSAFAIKAAIDLPIQGQCEPPDDFAWFRRMRAAGIDTLGMHLEAVTPEVRGADHAGQGRGCRSSATSRPSRRRCRCSAAARSAPTSWPAWATRREAILACASA